ncbi:hypothetical protein J6590_048828 [Homalodisca vitripennis]|nr:hypothetical protein J6590_048828 [Homalodisca vitripennis]
MPKRYIGLAVGYKMTAIYRTASNRSELSRYPVLVDRAPFTQNLSQTVLLLTPPPTTLHDNVTPPTGYYVTSRAEWIQLCQCCACVLFTLSVTSRRESERKGEEDADICKL